MTLDQIYEGKRLCPKCRYGLNMEHERDDVPMVYFCSECEARFIEIPETDNKDMKEICDDVAKQKFNQKKHNQDLIIENLTSGE